MNQYDFILRFDLDKHDKAELDVLLNKIRNLIAKEGYFLEKTPKASGQQSQKKKPFNQRPNR